jgi:hypothetical protein
MNTSQRVIRDNKPRIAGCLSGRLVLSRVLVVALFFAALLMSIYLFGLGSGVFVAIVILVTAGSCSVLLAPFRYINLWHLSTGYAVCTFFELFVL